MDDTIWNLSVLNLDRNVGVNTFFEVDTLLSSGRKSSSGSNVGNLSKHLGFDCCGRFFNSTTLPNVRVQYYMKAKDLTTVKFFFLMSPYPEATYLPCDNFV